MSSTAAEERGFRAWVGRLGPAEPMARFRVAFAAIWLAYDVLDASLGGTRGSFWSSSDPRVHSILLGTQLTLIILEAALLIGWKPRLMALLACAARASEARIFMLNDFLYYCVAALFLAQARTAPSDRAAGAQVPSWPREALVLQTAWIYFATGLLKLNPVWLSGGELYVRQNYLAVLHGWPYPGFYLRWISALGPNAALAWAGVCCELLLSATLVLWWAKPALRRPVGMLATVLALGIHLFAAATANVFFFGASMIAQVGFLTHAGQTASAEG